MIILRKNSHGEIMSLYGNIYDRSKENKSKILTKNTSPYFHSALLFIWPLTTLKGTHFSKGFSYVRIKPRNR